MLRMHSGIIQLLLLIIIASPILAEDTNQETTEAAPSSAGFLTSNLIGDKSAAEYGLSLRGWLAQGYTANGDSPDGNFNGPLSFNDRSNEYQMNQLYMVMERSIDKSKSHFDLGGRFDLLYGTDAAFTQALGWDDQIVGDSTSRFYKLAMPQLYAEGLLPIGTGLSIKAGHFYTLIGYEVVTAPDNFFYSHPFTFQYGEPATHTGVLASYNLLDNVAFTGGVTRGWDNVSDSDKETGFLGSLGWSAEGSSLTLALTTGDEAPGLNRTMYSLVFSQEFCEDWKWVIQHDWGYQEDGNADGGPAQWYGVNNYLFYKVSEQLSLGGRVEWFRDDDGVRVAGLRSGSPAASGDFIGTTLGLNYLVLDYLKIRPEVRFDYQNREDAVSAAYGDSDSVNQWTAAVDAILSF